MRNLCLAVGLAALFVVSHSSSGVAASAYRSAGASYSSHSSNASYAANASGSMSRAEEPVPPNCIRQSCGKLWCWQMKGSASH